MNAVLRKEEPYYQIIIKIIILIFIFISISLFNYLLFHTLLELFCVILAFNIFLLGWNHRIIINNNFILFISLVYLFIGILDTFHAITYQGINIIQNSSLEATQLWVSSRFMESISILIAFLFLIKKFKIKVFWILFIYSAITLLILFTITFTHVFPECYIPGSGLTLFKIISEYLICCIYLANAFLIIFFRKSLNNKTFILLLISFMSMMIGEFLFTYYISAYGLSNLIGHFFKLSAVYFYYKAIVITGIFTPYCELIEKTNKQNKQLIDANNKLQAREFALSKTDSMLKVLVEKLKFAKGEAENSNASKSKFLANMSHELRTPLNSIIGFSRILNEEMFGELNAKQKEYTSYIFTSGNHLLALINDILDISKNDSGKLKLFITKIDIGQLIDNSVSMVKLTCDEHNISINVKCDDNLPGFNGDERKIKQILYNILSNAVKFTPDKGDISIKCTSKNNNIFISVKDSGIGIESENNHKVFSEFEQIDSVANMENKGTGLGMPLSKRLVELHGGKLWFESEGNGKGTTFFIMLPIMKGCKMLTSCRFFNNNYNTDSELYKTIKESFCYGNYCECARFIVLDTCGKEYVPDDLTPYGETRAEKIIQNYRKEVLKNRNINFTEEEIQEKLIWNEAYSVGVEEIDEQHKKLIGIADKLYAAINEDNMNSSEIKILLQMLLEYSEKHFETEEGYFKSIQYPEIDKHKEEHNKFARSIKEFIVKFNNDEINEFELLSFLLEWIINHICYEDMKYKEYFEKPL